MLIQTLLIAAVVLMFVIFATRWNTAGVRAWKRLAFLAFCVVNAYAVLRPGDTTRVAHFLGVGRGTDLVLYFLVVGVTGLALNTYLRFRSLEQRLTELARDTALRTAHRPEADAPAAADRTPALVPSEGNPTGDHR
ncbi:DUF2304 domain-containing protein [Actinacidiphila epipremni]|jgi:hypothetical protein|uniref:DUF2304 domain-containing protein n=1 Tax=Actinacidiphila epipremni TaxID=2053013 RepID=A0ABX0ZKB4_9ACTN|nr:DUF2304 domain-containing protein [Actinacidiphila epipremni]NJP42088.1 DUF2304 domain-containing protein [Actinacidiphila epipremni]